MARCEILHFPRKRDRLTENFPYITRKRFVSCPPMNMTKKFHPEHGLGSSEFGPTDALHEWEEHFVFCPPFFPSCGIWVTRGCIRWVLNHVRSQAQFPFFSSKYSISIVHFFTMLNWYLGVKPLFIILLTEHMFLLQGLWKVSWGFVFSGRSLCLSRGL